jgi:peptide/nickel transport system substrate-binding protein
LEAVGWGDTDGDPNTPLTAINVANVIPGTPLSVNYATTEAPLRMEVTQLLAASLAKCGIQIQVHYLAPGELFAPGPEGILFGRKFDLAEFSWEAGSVPPCSFFESSQIPTSENNWLTLNLTGYSNPTYDMACKAARSVRPDQEEVYIQRQKETQKLFAAELPVIPLFYKLKIAAARPDFCGLQMDATARSALWNLETYDYGSPCQ